MGGCGRRLRGGRRYFLRELCGPRRGLRRCAHRPPYPRLPTAPDTIAQGAANVARDLTTSPREHRGDGGSPCVCRKLRPFDLVTESLNVSDDVRAAILFIEAVGLAVQVEEPT